MSQSSNKKLQSQLYAVKSARFANESKIEDLLEAVERIKKDVQLSLDKEAELESLLTGTKE